MTTSTRKRPLLRFPIRVVVLPTQVFDDRLGRFVAAAAFDSCGIAGGRIIVGK